MKLVLLLLPLILLIGAAAYVFIGPRNEASQPTPLPTTTETQQPATNPTSQTGPLNSYTINIPSGFVFKNEGDYSRRIAKDIPPQGQGNPTFIYISIVPKDQEKAEGTIYNYNQTDFNKLIRSQPSSTIVLGDSINKDLNSYFTYTHEEGTMISGFGAKTFVNKKPWEFPSGTTEYRYIVEMANVHYIVGAYLNTDATSPGHITRAEFDQILTTLKLTPDNIVLTNLPPVTNGQTKTYNSPEHKLTFAYPADWIPRDTLEPGQIFSIYRRGETQRPQSEMHDGALFGAYRPEPAPPDLKAWMKAQYETSQELTEPAVYGQYSANNVTYETIKVCGLGCFNYYHTIQNGKLYRFMLMSVGPQEKEYTETLQKIINTATYLK